MSGSGGCTMLKQETFLQGAGAAKLWPFGYFSPKEWFILTTAWHFLMGSWPKLQQKIFNTLITNTKNGSPVFCQLEFWHRGLFAYGILSIGLLAYRILSFHFRHTVFWQCMSIGISKVMITTWTVNCVNYCYFTNSGHLILLNIPYFT